jgi:pimeloyl-ACP methyl ester carboxylesterase
MGIRKFVIATIATVAVLYIAICLLLYLFQEKLIFFPDKLPKDFKFRFADPFEEVFVGTDRNGLIHGLLFKNGGSRGLIFYLHGNAGAVDSWGEVAGAYKELGYDIFILDYPGYGKSQGSITSEEQLFRDIQKVYDTLKKSYREDGIVIIGYSIGTGPAAKLASVNRPKMLILQAPYYSLSDVMRQHYPWVPPFLLKYKFRTNEFLRNCKMPVVVFHGTDDEVISYGSSLKLQSEMKDKDTLITLKGQGHNGITDNPEYLRRMRNIFQTDSL